MVPSLSKILPWSRARRWRKLAYDPAQAPHRQLVTDLVRAHVPPLTVRLRDDAVQHMVLSILRMETSPIPLVEDPLPRQLFLLVLRMQQAIEHVDIERDALHRTFARFSETYARVEDPDEQRRLVTEYLHNTITDSRQLQGDLAALNRFFGYDVLRERNATEMADLTIKIETGIEFIGRAGRACLTSDDPSRPALAEFFAQSKADRFLAVQLERADRWQTRLAAAISLFQIYGETMGSAGSSVRTAVLDATVLAALERCARNHEEDPWVQAKALQTLMTVLPDRARAILQARLFADEPSPLRTDFLFRRQAVTLAVEHLSNLTAEALLQRMAERPDPSEHVRMGVCEAMGKLPPSAAVDALVRFMGAPGLARESSPRVRAAAVIALAGVLTTSVLDAKGWHTAGEALLDLFASDSDLLVLQIACDELPRIGEELKRVYRSAYVDDWGPRWIMAVERMSASQRTPPQASDLAATTAERLERLRSDERCALVQYLGSETIAIPVGRRRLLRWKRMQPEAARALRDPMGLGRTMAELTATDYGLAARITRRGLLVWRGDLFERRLWRILHEMRTPGPNKRQGHVHTWGRAPRGDLRAPPSGLDEVTPTTVPGERTFVDEAGGWGRYLASVDDILDLPILRCRQVRIFSSHGVTTLTPARALWRRLWNRLYLSLAYRRFATLRMAALSATEAGTRHQFVRAVEERLRAKVEFTPYDRGRPEDPESPVALRVQSLFTGKAAAILRQPGVAAMVPAGDIMRDWLSTNGPYFLSLAKNSQTALAIFLSATFAWFLVKAHLRRRELARARASVPLSIGGWGTRGKSGTERLKGGLLHGMGYHVMAKTTGCEAMFVNAAPGQQAQEIFLYRPYDKATIWEQADVITLASKVKADVFLWECMALNPRYVELLQHDWMRDDLVTLTNAYPDHEDIQGPAGCDVAEVIARFIPFRSTLITSETNFLPLFRDVARQRHTTLHPVAARDGDLIASDMLALFPYSEHPRNIALVARMAQELGFEWHMAIALMALNVVPDLGVLKSYGPICVRGRDLTFICGNSANERTGFMNNWRRTGCDKLDIDADPTSYVITVVNNRADRISRSKVFADILVNDTAVDRHVLIGTNLKGLHSYLNTALGEYLAGKALVQPADFDEPDGATVVMRRLEREMKRLRIPAPGSETMVERLRLFGLGARLALASGAAGALQAHIDQLLGEPLDGTVALAQVQTQLEGDQTLAKLVEQALVAQAPEDHADVLETREPPQRGDVVAHWMELLARVVVRARLEARLRQVMETRAGVDELQEAFDSAFRELFNWLLVSVDDPGTPGDKIIDICARSVPPGVHCMLMGAQNIKGTGLDFVYRWIAVDKVMTTLAQLDTERQSQRTAALSELEGISDYGLFGAGLARAALAEGRFKSMGSGEDGLRERVLAKVTGVIKERMPLLAGAVGKGSDSKVLVAVESWLDYLDSIRRRKMSGRIIEDLIHRRISLGRASIEMRDIVARQKGGWLIKTLARSKGKKK